VLKDRMMKGLWRCPRYRTIVLEHSSRIAVNIGLRHRKGREE